MATYTKRVLSGSTDGKQILITATTSSGTTVHTAVTGTSDIDEVWLYATNNDSSAVSLTLLWGGSTSPNDYIQMSIPSKTGLYLIVPGLVLQNSNVIKAFANTGSVISISGWVNRITA